MLEDGQVVIPVKITTGSGFSWFKTYQFYTTEKIKLEAIKNRIRADVREDIQLTKSLDEIKPIIGQEFRINL